MKVRASFSFLAVPATLVVVLVTGGACMVNQPVTPGTYGPLEYDTDRAGSDFHSFDLPEARPDLCLSYCQNEPQCLAFTYVKPGIQGPAPRCWLKSAIPQPAANGCCVSGVVRPAPAPAPAPAPSAGGLEPDTDRAGSDYRSFDLPQPAPELCQSACAAEPQCRAFTYVRPGVQGPSPRCWLKSSVPNPTSNACCTSGVRR
jgi:1-phosphatidylinositol phosphodiesterase